MMEQKGRKPKQKRIKVLMLVLASAFALALIWGLAIEPVLLTVSGVEYADSRLPRELDGVRIIYISDVHASPFYKPDAVERLCKRILEMKPDMLLFGGDMVQHEAESELLDRERVSAAFAAIDAPLGKFAVYGNHDIISPVTKAVAESIFIGGGFTILENDAVEAAPGFYVAGTAPWPTAGENAPGNHADINRVAWTTQNSFSLLLSHEPAQLRKNSEYPFALQLSGHTHGGQIALPFIRSLRTRDGLEVYQSGFYRRNGTTMYVSRGIGTSIVRIRLFTPPEIVVLTLRRAG